MLLYLTAVLISALCSALFLNPEPYRSPFQKAHPYQKSGAPPYAHVGKWLSFLPLFLVSACRYDVGTDTLPVYFKGYYRLEQGFPFPFEPGFRFLCRVCSILFHSPQSLIAVSSFLFLFLCWNGIYRMSASPPMSILLLVLTNIYFISMNMVRQSIAVAIFYLALQGIPDGKFLRYLALMLAAALIHKSTLLILPVWFFLRLRIKPPARITVLVFLLASLPVWKELFTQILLRTPYAGYLAEWQDRASFGPWSFAVNLAVFLFLCILPHEDSGKYGALFSNLQLLAVFFSGCSAIFPLASRIVCYFSFSQLLFLPEAVNRVQRGKARFVLWGTVLLLYFINMWVTIVVKGGQGVLPYTAFFQV